MKFVVTTLATLFIGQIASAGTLTCNGHYWWVQFAAQATTSDRAITSDVAIKITGAPGGTKFWNLKPQTSEVSIGQAISFSAQAPEGSGSMTSQYNGQYYVGTIVASTSYGNYTVPVKCTLSQGFRR